MDTQMILLILIILILVVNIFLILLSRKKNNNDDIVNLLKQNSKEQNDAITKELRASATEQFERFGLIQGSVNKTLQENRLEVSNQIEKINATLEGKIKELQESNEKRLEQMQGIVDEKLQKTLESRLSQSFELVSKQLESVQQGLGEMKNLAADAKSLKNALTNVKERGTYGEIRLERLLSDFLAPHQYEVNAEIIGGKRVDFAVKLPVNNDGHLLLPIDSKFPIEDYNRLINAEDKASIEEARKALSQRIKAFAKDISEKYISPPKTTDFALMFLPTEGLYAEVVQNPSLFEELRDKYKITVVGATTLSAYLSSLETVFKTLTIEKQSEKVWNTLRAVKKSFDDFEKMLETARKQLQTADSTIEKIAGTRMRAINRAFRDVESIDGEDSILLDLHGN